MNNSDQRKRLRRFNLPGQARELTFSTSNKRPLLLDPDFAKTTLRAMDSTIPESDFSLLAFVIMPEHVHLLLVPRPGIKTPDPKRLLRVVKRQSSYDIKRLLQDRGESALLNELIVTRPDRTVFRFWLPGGGYDRNLTSTDSVQASFDYIHNNPVKRGLCRTLADFEWTSATQWQDPNSAVPEWMPKVDRLL